MRFEQHPVTFDPPLVFPWGHVHTADLLRTALSDSGQHYTLHLQVPYQGADMQLASGASEADLWSVIGQQPKGMQ